MTHKRKKEATDDPADAERKTEELEVTAETVQDLTPREAEGARGGGYVVGERPSLVLTCTCKTL